MELINFIMHIDHYLVTIIEKFGVYSYGILFLILFAETGLVITPFLPGDSLLFAIGALAAAGAFDPLLLVILLSIAAILGDSVNYAVGNFLGERLSNAYPKIIKKEYLEQTRKFYEKYGNKTIVIARFVPIVRTFAPFVAGIGKMPYSQFLFYNVFGGILWITLFILGGYFFGNIPIIKENFSITILVIIIASLVPVIIEVWKIKRQPQTT